MRRFFSVAAALAVASLLIASTQSGFNDDLLKIEASIRPKSLSRGEEGRVVMRVLTRQGITLSPHPSLTIEFTPCPELVFPKDFYTNSDLDIEVLKQGGEKFLNMSKPVEIPFTVSLQAKRGSHILEGRVKYFACSRKEGWCLKDTARFSMSFTTRQLSIR